MRWRLLFLLLVVVVPLFAQSAASGPSPTIELWARPLKSITTATAKPGEVVTLELWREVRDQGGVLIPKGARLFGVLTLVEPRSGHHEARLAIYVMRAEWKGGSATLNAFLAGPVCRPSQKSGASLVGVDRAVVRVTRGLFAQPSSRHGHIRVEGDSTFGVVYASRDGEITLSADVLIPLRHIPAELLERAAR